jgi:hypothetical protein
MKLNMNMKRKEKQKYKCEEEQEYEYEEDCEDKHQEQEHECRSQSHIPTGSHSSSIWHCAGLYEMTNTMRAYRYSDTGMTCKCRKWEGNVVDLLVTPATKSKPRQQEGTTKMSGCNKL